MKNHIINLLILSGCLLLFFNCTTTPEMDAEHEAHPDEEEHFREHAMLVHRRFEVQETKSTLFALAREWLMMKLAGPEEEIDYENREEGVIIGVGFAEQKTSRAP